MSASDFDLLRDNNIWSHFSRLRDFHQTPKALRYHAKNINTVHQLKDNKQGLELYDQHSAGPSYLVEQSRSLLSPASTCLAAFSTSRAMLRARALWLQARILLDPPQIFCY